MRFRIFQLFMLLSPAVIMASGGGLVSEFHLDGSIDNLNIFWVIPFVGILLSIAVFPLAVPSFWHRHFGKVSFFWAAVLIIPLLFKTSLSVVIYELLHVGLLEYFPFIILLLALLRSPEASDSQVT